ncbi:hypothetical protein HDU67_002043 [Dinochytrium kinnereticum]|nr:hypothetical protein HDU67_002043 [Dinochytrium kinnereticum]
MPKLPHLASELNIGSLKLKNRYVMASMTRNRALVASIPTESMVTYYKQRCSAGLILTEGIFIEPMGGEWPFAPGIWNKPQVEGWRKVVKAVHEEGTAIVAQLWHIGRVAHPLHQAGQPNVGPSAITANGGKFRLLDGHPGYVQPIAIEDPKVYVEMYRKAAVNAKEAGFDALELHAANDLPHQFLETHSNKRTDAYGGSIENRTRFALDIIKALIEVMGDASRVGIKLSPCGGYNDMGDPMDVAKATYTHLIKELDAMKIGYIQISRHSPDFDPTGRGTKMDVVEEFRGLIKNSKFLLNGGLQGVEAEEMVANKIIDGAVFGRPFLANPNLPKVLEEGGAPKYPDFTKLYTPGDDGYIDYE